MKVGKLALVLSVLPLLVFTVSGNPYAHANKHVLKIGFVENSFTGAAYRYQGFYDFYDKYGLDLKNGKNVTQDLDYLTAKIPRYSVQYQPSLLEDLPVHVRQLLPHSNVSIISDVNVHNGSIFKYNNSELGN